LRITPASFPELQNVTSDTELGNANWDECAWEVWRR